MRISEERLARYRELAGRDRAEVFERDTAALMARAAEQGADLLGWGFPSLGFFRAPLSNDLSSTDIACVGIPLDAGSPWSGGSRFGPKALREASQSPGLIYNSGSGVVPMELARVSDYGDLGLAGMSHAEAMAAITETFARFRDFGVVPLATGGEHTVTHAVLKGLIDLDHPVGLVHFDAHADTLSAGPGVEAGDSVADTNWLSWAVLDGLVDPDRTVQIGLRGALAGSMERIARDLGMRSITIEEFERLGVEAVVEEARRVVGTGPCYLTFDTDALGSPYMQGTNLSEPFGISDREARDLLRGLRGLDLVGADLLELTPANDLTGASSRLASGLAFEMLCLLAEAACERHGERRSTNWA